MSITLLPGDCREVVEALPSCSVDSVVTDPPYALVSIQKRFGKPGSAPAKDRDGLYKRASSGFMGKQWDTGEVAFDPAFWAEVLRVLKPGGHLLAFGGTRTYHRLACAIEDAGFEIRDQVGWLYGTGFPKSELLKPAWEPIVLARKDCEGTRIANIEKYGTGGLNIDACRIPVDGGRPLRVGDYKATDNAVYDGRMDGSLRGGSKAAGVTDLGRYPANVIHDGSDEVIAALPDAPGQMGRAKQDDTQKTNTIYGKFARNHTNAPEPRGDVGSAARFFYCAKAGKRDRAGSKHPTVKPVKLLSYLCRLVTPPGGTVLDPFAGSGTTGQAALDEGLKAILIEREAEYLADIRRRFGLESDELTALLA